ncbi:hypothetical protein GS458_0236 [Geobacillus stearothermophilus]|nr:hypothetical protein GS458_0236 [Geobacillus stearothermophilus]
MFIEHRLGLFESLLIFYSKGTLLSFGFYWIINTPSLIYIKGGIVVLWIIIQFGLAAILLLFSTLAAWYEGSAILDNPWEWKHSTPFSQMMYGQVHSKSHISQLDYFVYSAKFHPFFPIIMGISSLYLLILIGYYFLKPQNKKFACFLFILGGGLFLLGCFFMDSTTTGGKIFFYIWLVSGSLCTATAIITYFQVLNHNPRR